MKRYRISLLSMFVVVCVLTLPTSSSAESTRLFSMWQPHKSSPEELLRSAAYEGNVQGIQRLLAGGTAVDSRDKEGWTPLIWAQAGDRVEAIALLLARGADINAKDRMGCTALHQAATAGRVNAMAALLAHDTDVENISHTGYTPLMDASLYGRTVAVELLLANGADPNAVNVHGHTAVSLADKRGHRNVAMLLAANGADPYLQGKKLQAALAGMSSRNKGPSRVRLAGHMRNSRVLEELCEQCLSQKADPRVRFVAGEGADVSSKLAAWCRQSRAVGRSQQETGNGQVEDRRPHAVTKQERDGASYLLREAIETWEQIQAKYPDAHQRAQELTGKGISKEKLTSKEPLLQKAMSIWMSLQSEHPELASQLMNIAGLGR